MTSHYVCVQATLSFCTELTGIAIEHLDFIKILMFQHVRLQVTFEFRLVFADVALVPLFPQGILYQQVFEEVTVRHRLRRTFVEVGFRRIGVFGHVLLQIALLP